MVGAESFGGTAGASLGNLAVDGSGNIFADGTFNSTANFGGISLTPSGGSGADVFIVKLAPNFVGVPSNAIWAEQLGGGLSDYGTSLGLDGLGNVYVGGEFSGVVNFNTGAGAPVNLSSIGQLDSFVEKFDTNGVSKWALSAGGPANDSVLGLAVHGPDDVTLVGRYSGPASFGPNQLPGAGNASVYLARVSATIIPTVLPPANFLSAFGLGVSILDIHSAATDAAGNSYVIGYFNGTVNFDPNGGLLAANGLPASLSSLPLGTQNLFVAKYSPSGSLQWVEQLVGSTSKDQTNAVAVDPSNGNVLITGYFTGSLAFGTAGTLTTTPSNYDGYVAAISPTGGFVWAKSFGGAGIDMGSAVVADSSGHVYVGGTFTNAATFPGAVSVSDSGSNAYIAQFNDLTGQANWVTPFGNNNGSTVNHLAVDTAGNVYTSGTYTSAISYNTTTGARSLAGSGIYALKETASGAFVWANGLVGSGLTAGGLAVDGSGDVFLDGSFKSAVNFAGISPTIGPVNAKGNAFVVKLNPDGSGANWVNTLGGTNFAQAIDLGVDTAGNIYVGGLFGGSILFNTAAGAKPLISGAQDVYVEKLDTNGMYIWAQHAGGGSSSTNVLRSLSVTAPDDVTIVGKYAPPVNFSTIALAPTKSSSSNVFLARIAQPTPPKS